jgi:hypothetical protein
LCGGRDQPLRLPHSIQFLRGAKSAFIAIPQAAQNSELIAQFSFANSKISIYQKYNLSLGVYEVIGDSHILSNS